MHPRALPAMLCYLLSFDQAIEQSWKGGLALIEDHSKEGHPRRLQLFSRIQQQIRSDSRRFHYKNRPVARSANGKCVWTRAQRRTIEQQVFELTRQFAHVSFQRRAL